MIRNWIIKKLGGVTQLEYEDKLAQYEAKRAQYERWAVEHLKGKHDEVTPDCSFYRPYDGDSIVVIRSRIHIMNCRINDVKVAPWCNGVVLLGLST